MPHPTPSSDGSIRHEFILFPSDSTKDEYEDPEEEVNTFYECQPIPEEITEDSDYESALYYTEEPGMEDEEPGMEDESESEEPGNHPVATYILYNDSMWEEVDEDVAIMVSTNTIGTRPSDHITRASASPYGFLNQ